MSGHGGNPGKFEPCRRFEVGYHNTFLVHPGTKTAACLHGELYTEVRIFIPGSSCTRMCVRVRTELNSARDEFHPRMKSPM